MHILPVLLTLLLPSLTTARSSSAILLRNVKHLTLRAGHQTSARRTSPIPQLRCVGGNARAHSGVVESMRCTNIGSAYDGDDVQWTCTASLPAEFKLGGTEVLCEGYSGPTDPYVLKGSCGVEYRLVLTERGEERFGSGAGGGGTWGERIVVAAVAMVFLAVFAKVIYDCCTGANRQRPPRRPGGFGGGWGGGGGGPGDDGNDPPPPYSRMPPPKGSSNAQQGGGFWNPTTAAMAGAAAGYFAGRAGNSNRDRYQGRNDNWRGGSGSGWGSGSGSSSSSRGSTNHESTGFGGTTRR